MSNYQKKKLAALEFNNKIDEDNLIQKMFVELQEKELLKEKRFGGVVSLIRQQQVIAKIIFNDLNDALEVAKAMEKYFIENKLLWVAKAEQIPIF